MGGRGPCSRRRGGALAGWRSPHVDRSLDPGLHIELAAAGAALAYDAAARNREAPTRRLSTTRTPPELSTCHHDLPSLWAAPGLAPALPRKSRQSNDLAISRHRIAGTTEIAPRSDITPETP